MKKRIIIIGAGVAGLAAGWKILQNASEYDVTIIEREAVPGGLAKTIEWNGYLLDLGPHRFHTEIPEIKAFIKTFCEERMVKTPRFSRMHLNGRYIPYPIKPWATFQALGAVNSAAFFASALGVLFSSKPKSDESYEDYVIQYYGAKLYQRIFQPFAEKVWGIDPKELDGEVAKVRLRGDNIWQALLDGLFSQSKTYVDQFLYPPKGIGEIPRQFADEFERRGGSILCNHMVKRIDHDGGAIQGAVAVTDGEERYFECDVLIPTQPLPAFLNALRPAPPAAVLKSAQTLKYRALVLLYLIYPEAHGIRDTWLYYPERHVPFSRISVPENFTELNRAPGKTCLCLEYPCEIGDETWNADAAALALDADEILTQSGLVRERSSDALAVQVKEGYPLYTQGYQTQLDEIFAHIQSLGNCAVTGRQGLFRHNNTDQSIQMGLDAAEHALNPNATSSDWHGDLHRYKEYRIVD